MEVAFEGDDEIHWPHDSSAQFHCKKFWIEICKGLTRIDFQDEAIRKSKAPTKALFFFFFCLNSHKG